MVGLKGTWSTEALFKIFKESRYVKMLSCSLPLLFQLASYQFAFLASTTPVSKSVQALTDSLANVFYEQILLEFHWRHGANLEKHGWALRQNGPKLKDSSTTEVLLLECRCVSHNAILSCHVMQLLYIKSGLKTVLLYLQSREVFLGIS